MGLLSDQLCDLVKLMFKTIKNLINKNAPCNLFERDSPQCKPGSRQIVKSFEFGSV